MAETNTRQASRAPVTLKIKFKSETLDQFIERYSVDISHGGIFIRTKDPLAVGTSLKFEFQLKDATPLIIGDGTVVWTREPDAKRTGVSPGMGVRFDKLPSESQKILDQVLAKKGGKLKSEVDPLDSDDDAAGDFVDTPTRVAPAGLVDSLTTEDDYSEGDLTPLPKPMPFHGDASEFDDEAFNESTKVASLDSILAQAKSSSPAEDSSYDEDAVFASTSAPAKTAAKVPEKKEGTPAADYEDPFADLNEPADKAPVSARPDSERADSRAETTTMSLKTSSERSDTALDEGQDNEDVSSDAPETLDEDSNVEDEQSQDAAKASSQVDADSEADDDSELDDDSEVDDDDDGVDAKIGADASSTQSAAARATVLDPTQEDERGSSMPWIAVAAVILLIGGAGGFWLLNKDGKGTNKETEPAAKATTPVVTDPPKLAEDAIKDPEKQPEVPETPVVATTSVAITTAPEGATLSVLGTEFSATSPASFDLEEGKTYTIEVRHDAFLAQSFEIVANNSPIEIVKLVAKPKLIRINSDPPGAIVTIAGQRLKQRTPVDVPVNSRMEGLTNAQVQLRLPGYKVWQGSVDMKASFAPSDTEIVSSLEIKLEDIPRAVQNDKPDPVKPDAVKPDAVKPDAVKPDAVKPDAVKPDAVKPDAVKPDAVKPDAVKPDAVKPDAVKPDAVKPDPVKPAPDPAKTGGGEPTPDWMK